MKSVLLWLLMVPSLSFGQFPHFNQTEPTGEPDIHYYNFCNGIQMIEFDFLSAYHRKLNYLEQEHPRALSWHMVIGPPRPNVYLFRNEKGEIVKHYGNDDNIKILSVQESLKKSKTHDSFLSQLGSVRGFSQITTRYFPYYQIGSNTDTPARKSGLIDSLGNVVLQPEYDDILKHDNLFITRRDSTFELRNINLRIVFSSHEYQLYPSQFHSEHADLLKNRKCGLMGPDGKIIVPCKYDMRIDRFNEMGLAKVRKRGLTGFVDTTGKEVISCKYESVGDFKEGLLNALYNDKWGYIDDNGHILIPHQYDIGCWFQEGLARVAKQVKGKYYFGFIDKKGKEIIPLIYTNAKDFRNGMAEVMVDGNWIKIDQKGKQIE